MTGAGWPCRMEIEAAVDRTMWWPDYVPFEPGR